MIVDDFFSEIFELYNLLINIKDDMSGNENQDNQQRKPNP